MEQALTVAEYIPLSWSEEYIEHLLSEHPHMLGLGPSTRCVNRQLKIEGNRVDLIFVDDVFNFCYTVEIQLGAADQNHIDRLKIYTKQVSTRPDLENYDHVAVLIAEDVSALHLHESFKNIPTLLIGMKGLTVGDKHTLCFTRAYDSRPESLSQRDDAGDSVPTFDWKARYSEEYGDAIVRAIQNFKAAADAFDPYVRLSYNKRHLVMKRGSNRRLLPIWLSKDVLWLSIATPHSREFEEWMDSNNIKYDDYGDRDPGQYMIGLTPELLNSNPDAVAQILRRDARLE